MSKLTNEMIGKRVIVRSHMAGVFFGTLAEKDGEEVVLTDVRKIHYWNGAGAVEQLASDGVSAPERCRFTVFTSSICVIGVCQILPCTEKSIKSLESVKEWRL